MNRFYWAEAEAANYMPGIATTKKETGDWLPLLDDVRQEVTRDNNITIADS